MRFFLVLILLISFPTSSYARDEIIVNCKLTPMINNEASMPKPEEFGRTNNLRRITGSAVKAYGRFIAISGRVVDENCVPVSDAVVQIWQMNWKGKYQHKILKDDEDFDKNFIGSGRVVTDNLGRFHFLTIKPGREKGRSPHINISITHKNFDKFTTSIYFADEKILNYYDKELDKIDNSKKSLIKAFIAKDFSEVINNELTYVIDITIKGSDKFRRY